MKPFEWQKIYENRLHNIGTITKRVKVPGGWLVSNVTLISDGLGHGLSEALTFVADAAHRWVAETVE